MTMPSAHSARKPTAFLEPEALLVTLQRRTTAKSRHAWISRRAGSSLRHRWGDPPVRKTRSIPSNTWTMG